VLYNTKNTRKHAKTQETGNSATRDLPTGNTGVKRYQKHERNIGNIRKHQKHGRTTSSMEK
jgi:hypothetical protein